MRISVIKIQSVVFNIKQLDNPTSGECISETQNWKSKAKMWSIRRKALQCLMSCGFKQSLNYYPIWKHWAAVWLISHCHTMSTSIQQGMLTKTTEHDKIDSNVHIFHNRLQVSKFCEFVFSRCHIAGDKSRETTVQFSTTTNIIHIYCWRFVICY